MYLPTLVPCLVSCVSGGSSYAEASLCCHHVRTSLFVHRGSTVCGVLCVRRVVMLERLSVATTFALLCLCTGEVPCVVSCVSVGGLSCWSVSLCCHHVRTSLFVHRRSTVCCVLCVSRRVVMLERLSVATFALLCYPSLYTCVAALCQNLADFGGAIKNFTPVVLSATTTKSHGTEIATDLLRQWQQKS